MASPKNPLDRFVSYTYHFELHMVSRYEDLVKVIKTDSNLATTRTRSNGSLLINSRKDAHQSIDDVKFSYITAEVDPTMNMQAAGNLSMTIVEPGGSGFTEKIMTRLDDMNISRHQISVAAMFGLKIIFVGRPAGNGPPETLILPSIVPMALTEMDASFSNRGGEYHLVFGLNAHAAVPSYLDPYAVLGNTVGFANKNILISATTVGSALKELEQKLNSNYQKTYKIDLDNDKSARPLRYEINLKDRIFDGLLSVNNKESWAPGEPCMITLPLASNLIEMVKSIVFSSKDVTDVIGNSIGGLFRDGHPDVNIPTFVPRYYLTDTEAVIAIDIERYQGGLFGGEKYQFYYLFSDAGKNVDVLEMEIKFSSMLAWIATSKISADTYSNQSSTVPRDNPEVHKNHGAVEDVTVDEAAGYPVDPLPIPAKEGGVAVLGQVPLREKRDHVNLVNGAAQSARLAFLTINSAAAAVNNQVVFTIRGHFDLLNNCITTPDGKQMAFGINKGLWANIEIKDQDGLPFFYTGGYRIISIENIFLGGKFIQQISAMMMDEDYAVK